MIEYNIICTFKEQKRRTLQIKYESNTTETQFINIIFTHLQKNEIKNLINLHCWQSNRKIELLFTFIVNKRGYYYFNTNNTNIKNDSEIIYWNNFRNNYIKNTFPTKFKKKYIVFIIGFSTIFTIFNKYKKKYNIHTQKINECETQSIICNIPKNKHYNLPLYNHYTLPRWYLIP
jgi:hypothetical protein